MIAGIGRVVRCDTVDGASGGEPDARLQTGLVDQTTRRVLDLLAERRQFDAWLGQRLRVCAGLAMALSSEADIGMQRAVDALILPYDRGQRMQQSQGRAQGSPLLLLGLPHPCGLHRVLGLAMRLDLTFWVDAIGE